MKGIFCHICKDYPLIKYLTIKQGILPLTTVFHKLKTQNGVLEEISLIIKVIFLSAQILPVENICSAGLDSNLCLDPERRSSAVKFFYLVQLKTI